MNDTVIFALRQVHCSIRDDFLFFILGLVIFLLAKFPLLGYSPVAFLSLKKNNCEKNDAGVEKKIDIDTGEE